MAADHSTKPPSGDSSLSWQIMHISYKIGYLQSTCDRILAAVTATPPTATRLPWHKIAELAMGAWKVFGPLVTHYIVPIVVAALGLAGAGILAAFKWLLPFMARLLGY